MENLGKMESTDRIHAESPKNSLPINRKRLINVRLPSILLKQTCFIADEAVEEMMIHMNILDKCGDLDTAYDSTSRQFDLEKWKLYMDRSLPEAKDVCLADLKEGLDSGLLWEKDYLPVLNAVVSNPEAVRETVSSFHQVTDSLEEKVLSRFGRTVDVDIILYLGLCSGAGWVTPVDGRMSILLGIEKIVELNWSGPDAMNGLILHELGHIYQSQYGVLKRDLTAPADRFLWQLFTEGIAMTFEQTVVGSFEYFHEDENGWKAWCDAKIKHIADSFNRDLPHMDRSNQRYFGDWVRFEGRPDTGYYLGARFVQFILKQDAFDHVINYDMPAVRNAFKEFLGSLI